MVAGAVRTDEAQPWWHPAQDLGQALLSQARGERIDVLKGVTVNLAQSIPFTEGLSEVRRALMQASQAV